MARMSSTRLTNGNMVVIIDSNQIAKLEMTSSGGSLTGNTLHGTAVTKEDIGMVVGELKTGLVENSCGVGLSNGKTDCVGKALAERTGGNLNTRSVMSLWVAGSDAVDLLLGISLNSELEDRQMAYSEVLQIVQRQSVSEEMKKCILQHASVTVSTRWSAYFRTDDKRINVAVGTAGSMSDVLLFSAGRVQWLSGNFVPNASMKG